MKTPVLLVLTDFFSAAGRALDYATNLAVPLGARLVLLHVERDSLLDPEAFSGVLATENEHAAQLALNGLTHGLPVAAVAEVGHGRLLPVIAEAVSRHKPMLIVLGRPDREEFPDELTTTTALDILQDAPYPMLVVPPAYTSRGTPRRMLLAADGEAFELGKYARAAHQLLQSLPAELTVLHATSHPEEGMGAAALDDVFNAGLAQGLPTPALREVRADDPAEGILAAARPDTCDALVLLARRRSVFGHLFHRSVTARVLLHSQVPVLVLPVE
ncbi:MAG: hypothetical protein JWR44_1391 [Hymenobacter sp.]|jgi:nucleotide-binding universal stress UspA family protein|nr:hypothetical protein [Hymenobacter sp.]